MLNVMIDSFDRCQKTAAAHPGEVQKLSRLQDKDPEQFAKLFVGLVHHVLPVFKREKSAENIVKFAIQLWDGTGDIGVFPLFLLLAHGLDSSGFHFIFCPLSTNTILYSIVASWSGCTHIVVVVGVSSCCKERKLCCCAS